MPSARPAFVACVLACGACAAAPVVSTPVSQHATPPPESAAPTGAPLRGASTASPSEARPAPEATPSTSAPSSGEPVRAADSPPDGLTPLTAAEREDVATRCKALSDAIAAAGTKVRGKAPIDVAFDVLAHPPLLPNVDVPRCSSLLLQELAIYRARTIEVEAIVNLKRISFGMATAFAEGKALCPSAPPVPASLGEFLDEKYTSKPVDWKASGWHCLRFDQPMPQRFQYEVRVDVAAGAYEAIARRPAAAGGPASELFLRGRIEGVDLQPNSDVFRR